MESHYDDKKTDNKGNHHKDRPGRIRVLVAESNHDLRYLYQTYLDSFGLEMDIVDGGEACLSRLFKIQTTPTTMTLSLSTPICLACQVLTSQKKITKKIQTKELLLAQLV